METDIGVAVTVVAEVFEGSVPSEEVVLGTLRALGGAEADLGFVVGLEVALEPEDFGGTDDDDAVVVLRGGLAPALPTLPAA